jgi:hypothetical protein
LARVYENAREPNCQGIKESETIRGPPSEHDSDAVIDTRRKRSGLLVEDCAESFLIVPHTHPYLFAKSAISDSRDAPFGGYTHDKSGS